MKVEEDIVKPIKATVTTATGSVDGAVAFVGKFLSLSLLFGLAYYKLTDAAAFSAANMAASPLHSSTAELAKPLCSLLCTPASGVVNLLCGLGLLFNVQTKWAATAFIVESSLVAALAYVPAYFLGGQNPITMLLMTMVFAVIANLKPQSAFA